MSHIWMSLVTHEWGMSYFKCHTCRFQCHTWRSHLRYRVIMSHVTHMNESCTHTNESWRTYQWVMSFIWTSHVTHMTESCDTYEWVMSHIRMGHVTHTNDSCQTYEWVLSYIWRRHLGDRAVMSHVTYERSISHLIESHHIWELCHVQMSLVPYESDKSRSN